VIKNLTRGKLIIFIGMSLIYSNLAIAQIADNTQTLIAVSRFKVDLSVRGAENIYPGLDYKNTYSHFISDINVKAYNTNIMIFEYIDQTLIKNTKATYAAYGALAFQGVRDVDHDGYYDQFDMTIGIDGDASVNTAVYGKIICNTTGRYWWSSSSWYIYGTSTDWKEFSFDETDFYNDISGNTSLDFTVEIWNQVKTTKYAQDTSVNGEPVKVDKVYSISLSSYPSYAGTVSGSGIYGASSFNTIRATASSGYRFDKWTENGASLSTANPYSFTLTGNRNIVGNFSRLNSGSVQFSTAAINTSEGSGSVSVYVKRVGGSYGQIEVGCKTVDSTAIGWKDFKPYVGILTWNSGDTSTKKVSIPLINDTETEATELFKVKLFSPVNSTIIAPGTVKVYIAANTKGGAILKASNTLNNAIDNGTIKLNTSINAPWNYLQTDLSENGDVAISGVGPVSWLESELEGTGKLEFDWLVKGSGKDTCLILVNGKVRRTLISRYDWSHETITLGEGDHTIRWVFVGDNTLTPGAEYLDQVKWTPAE
jgi:hypothetical protein